MEARKAKRIQKVATMFSPTDTVGDNEPTTTQTVELNTTLKQLLIQVEQQYKKEISKSWETLTLQKYLEVNRVPRGLRIFTMPTHPETKTEMLNEWGENNRACSYNMMRILIKYAEKDLEDIHKNITELEAKIKLQNKEEVNKSRKEMEERIENYEEEVQLRKQRKFLRDETDYKTGRILTFAKRFDTLKTNYTKQAISLPRDPESESDISESDTEGPAHSGIQRHQNTSISFLEEMCLVNLDQNLNRNRGQGRNRGRGYGRGNMKTTDPKGKQEEANTKRTYQLRSKNKK